MNATMKRKKNKLIFFFYMFSYRKEINEDQKNSFKGITNKKQENENGYFKISYEFFRARINNGISKKA